MPKFKVYEVQEETVWRTFYYEVEADDARQALEKAIDGEVVPEDYGKYGDGDFGDSGWAVQREGEDEGDAICRAANALRELCQDTKGGHR